MANDRTLRLVVEALLFSSEKPLCAKDIQLWIPERSAAEITRVLGELRDEYETLQRSFHLKEVAEGFQFRTRAQYAPYVQTMMRSSPNRLSRAALETLAIIAYKQPVLKQEIEKLRGVDVGGILRTLLEKDLIRIVGRKNLPGRPLIYGTTRKFLEVFDLKDLESLPKLKEIKDLGTQAEEGTAVGGEADSQREEPARDEESTGSGEPRNRNLFEA